MKRKYLYTLVVLLLLSLTVVSLLNTQKTDSDSNWTVYENVEAGYRVQYPKEQDKEAVLKEFVFPGDSWPMKDSEANNRAFKYIRSNSGTTDYLLGSVHCAITHHLYDVSTLPANDEDLYTPLSNEMTLSEYAGIFYENILKTEEEAQPILKLHELERLTEIEASGYDSTLFAGRIAYTFTIIQNTPYSHGEPPLTVDTYIITENNKGQKCVISYNVYDQNTHTFTEISGLRQQWLQSFEWID